MTFNSLNFGHIIAIICISTIKYFILFLFPLKELMRTTKARDAHSTEMMSKFENFEKTVIARLSEKINNSNTANNTSNDASTSNTNTSSKTTDNNASTSNTNTNTNTNNTGNNNTASTSATSANAASTSANTASISASAAPKATSHPSGSQSPSSAASNDSSSSNESLTATVQHIQEQPLAAALDLSDKIDELKQENQALDAHIVALKNQLQEEKTETDNISNTLANRIDILERYVQNDSQFEDQRKQEVKEVQLLSQKNTDLLSKRISKIEDQLTNSFKEFEVKRSKELQSFASTFRDLKKRCTDLKVDLDQQMQQTTNQAKETAKNSATIKEAIASDVMANLGKTVREAMDLCHDKFNNVETGREMLQAAVDDASEDIKIVHERIVALEIEFDDMREEVRSDLAEMNTSIDSMGQDISHIQRGLGVQQGLFGTEANSPENV